MKKTIKAHSSRFVLACLLGLCASGALPGCWSPPPAAGIDEFIEYAMDFAKAPGLAAVIVKNGEVVWAKGYGWANVEEQVPVTTDTLFMTGSLAKTVMGTAVMQLYEQGLIRLDTDVNDYLPFSVRNPNHPYNPITVQMLLTHTSSIRDTEDMSFIYELDTEGADSPITLREFLEGFLVAGGQWYSETENFLSEAPGTSWQYSNFASTLAAYLAEVVSGQPYDEYCKENIFQPLGMTETSYRLSDLDVSHIAVRYEYDANNNSYKALPHVGHPAYPVGFLRTSVNEYARFLTTFMNGGALDGARILKAETVEEMLNPSGVQFDPDSQAAASGIMYQALSWMYTERGGQQGPSHSGGYPGCITNIFFIRDGSAGILWMANGVLADFFVLLPRPDVHLDERLLEEAKEY